ncbi:hypothetical protein EJB05_42060, partial [Eragrostis curvula]
MLHSLAHTDSWTVELSWDIVARFCPASSSTTSRASRRTRAVTTPCSPVSARLRELGSHYGALPAHDGLWDFAMPGRRRVELLLLGGRRHHRERRARIMPRHIQFAVSNDEELTKLLGGTTIASGGVELLPMVGGFGQTSRD